MFLNPPGGRLRLVHVWLAAWLHGVFCLSHMGTLLPLVPFKEHDAGDRTVALVPAGCEQLGGTECRQSFQISVSQCKCTWPLCLVLQDRLS